MFAAELDTSHPGLCGLRAYVQTGLPRDDSSVANVTTIYVGEATSNLVYLPVGGTLKRHSLESELSFSLGTLTANKLYDFWLYSNNGSVAVELNSTPWDSDTARNASHEITQIDGVYYKAADTTRMLLGTFYTTSTTETQDTTRQRLLWCQFNQRWRNCGFVQANTLNSYTYTNLTPRQMGGLSANQVELVCGIANYSNVWLMATHISSTVSSEARVTGIGIDSSTVESAQSQPPALGNVSGVREIALATYAGAVPIGYHSYRQLEYNSGSAGGTTSWMGTNNGARTFGTNGMVLQ